MKAEARVAAEKLWLVGKSQPEACDTLFSTWRADGQALTFVNASEAMTTQWSAFGASLSDLSTQDAPQ